MGRKARMELVLDCADPVTLKEFWREALHYRELYADDDVTLLVPTDDSNASPLVLQKVPEPRLGKNRMHLDIVVDDIGPEIARLEAIGARRLEDAARNVDDIEWVVMADPEDNEFCICTGVEW